MLYILCKPASFIFFFCVVNTASFVKLGLYEIWAQEKNELIQGFFFSLPELFPALFMLLAEWSTPHIVSRMTITKEIWEVQEAIILIKLCVGLKKFQGPNNSTIGPV